MFQIKKSILGLCLLLLQLEFLVGCSSSVLESSKGNDGKSRIAGQDIAVATCHEIDASTPTLSVKQFREFLACLNGNRSIDAYERLVERLSDRQLAPFVHLLNKQLLANDRRFKAVRESFEQMDQKGILDALLDRGSDFLGEDGLVLSALKLIRPAVLPNDGGAVDPLLLAALREIAKDLKSTKGARANVEKGLSSAVRLAGLAAWKELARGLGAPIAAPRPALRVLARGLFRYAQAKAAEPRAFGKLPLWGLVDGSLHALTDFYFSDGKKELYSRPAAVSDKRWAKTGEEAAETAALRIGELEALLQYLALDHRADVLPKVSLAFEELDRPLSCFGGSRAIPNGALHVLDRVSGFDSGRSAYSTARDLAILTKVGSDACEFPKNADALFDAIVRMTEDDNHIHGATFARLIRALRAADAAPIHSQAAMDLDLGANGPANERYQRLAVNLISDSGANPVGFLGAVVPAVAELLQSERSAVANLLYLSYGIAPRSKEREVLASIAASLLEPRDSLRVRDMVARSVDRARARDSIYDVLVEGLLKLDADAFADTFARAASVFSKDKAFARDLAKGARDALLINDANPLLDILLEVMEDSDRYAPLIQAVFEIAGDATQSSLLSDAVALTAKMSRDGSLKALIRGAFNVFDGRLRRVAGGPTLARSIPEVAPIPMLRNLSRKAGTQPLRERLALADPVFWPKSDRGLKACKALDPAVGVLDYGNPEWAAQLRDLAACVNADGALGGLESVAAFATDSSKTVRAGQPLAQFAARFASEFRSRLSGEQRSALLRAMGNQIGEGPKRERLKAMLDSLPLYLRKKWCAESSGRCSRAEESSLPQGLAELGQAIDELRIDVKPFTDFAAGAVAKQQLPHAFKAMVDAWVGAREGGLPVSTAQKPALDADLLRSIQEKPREKIKGMRSAEPADAQEVFLRFWNQVVSDRPMTGYASKQEFFNRVLPLLDSLADPKFGLLEQSITFFYLMDRNPYDPAWWDGWFNRLSSRRYAITYYYPGANPDTDNPVVRVIDQVDALELVVIDGDFSLDEVGQSTYWGGKFSLGFLEGIVLENDENFAIRNLVQLAMAGENINGWLEQLKRELSVFWSYITDENPNCAFINSKLSPLHHALKQGAGVDSCPQLFVPELKRRLYNLRQIVPVLETIASQQEYAPNGRGATVLRNDVGFLRDVFYTVLMATPKENRYVYKRERNSLNFIVNLVKSGVLRNVGTALWSVDGSGAPAATRLSPVISLLTKLLVLKEKGEFRVNANTLEVLKQLLQRDGCWMSDPNCAQRPAQQKYPFLSKVLSDSFGWSAEQRRVAKAAGYELANVFADADRAGAREGGFFLLALSQLLRPWLGTPEGLGLFREHWHAVEEAMLDRRIGSALSRIRQQPRYDAFLQWAEQVAREAAADRGGLSERMKDAAVKLENDPKRRASRFIDILGQISKDPAAKSLQRDVFEPQLQDAAGWMAEHGEISGKIQAHLSQRLLSGDAGALLRFSAANEEEWVNACAEIGSAEIARRAQVFIDDLAQALR